MTPNDVLYAILLISALVGAVCAVALMQHAHDRHSPEPRTSARRCWGYLAFFLAASVVGGTLHHYRMIESSKQWWLCFWTLTCWSLVDAITIAVRVVRNGRARARLLRRWNGGMVRIGFLLLPLLLVVGTGCGQPPLTQVYAARQTYTGSLDALTIAINTGKIHDRATLLAIKDLRGKIEKGLEDAEADARAGNTIGFKFLMNQLEGWLEEYLTLQKPAPATRPTSFNTETPWIPQRSSPSPWAELRPSTLWATPWPRSTRAGHSPRSRWLASAPSRLQPRPATTLQ